MTRLVSTTQRRYVPAAGDAGPVGYQPLERVLGEEHSARVDLGGSPSALDGPGARVLARVLQLSDLHVLDAASPARFDWLEAMGLRDPKWWPLLHMVRPCDVVVNWGVAAMTDAIAGSGGALADLAVITGDCIDNAQRNELDAYFSLLDGGSFAFGYHGPQRGSWAEDMRADDVRLGGLWPFWLPDGQMPDWYSAQGFPAVSGLLDAAGAEIRCEGIGLPWIGVLGNHDVMRAGTVWSDAVLERIAIGGQRTVVVPGLDPADPMAAFLADPSRFCTAGVARDVPADRTRRSINGAEFVAEHRDRGHGFAGDGDSSLEGNYIHDIDGVRLVVLDTNHPGGNYQGSVGSAQLEWLDAVIRGSGERPVVVVSHHGGVALNNTHANSDPTDRRYAADLEAVLHRTGKVVAWLVGHRHRNEVRAVPDPNGGPGFWEITTSSMIDWPHQGRVVEIIAGSDGSVGVRCTMVDHDADDVRADDPRVRHAALHRELSWNLMRVTGMTTSAGTTGDRNVVLPRGSR